MIPRRARADTITSEMPSLEISRSSAVAEASEPLVLVGARNPTAEAAAEKHRKGKGFALAENEMEIEDEEKLQRRGEELGFLWRKAVEGREEKRNVDIGRGEEERNEGERRRAGARVFL